MVLELFEQLTCLVGVAGAVEVTQALLDAIGDGHLGAGIAELEEGPQALGRLGVEFLLADEQDPSGPIERIVSAARCPSCSVCTRRRTASRQRLAREMTWKGSTTWAALGKITEYTAA